MTTRRHTRTATLHIKNMVCDRCIRVVREELERLPLRVQSVRLGEAVVAPTGGRLDREAVRRVLEANGFELLDDRRARLMEKTRRVLLRIARGEREHRRRGLKDSTLIQREVGLDYRYLSTLFSATEGMTIEQYIILQRIERVKELLRYDELSLKEIAFALGYSSVAHLSNQFKSVTGLTPTHFRKLNEPARIPLDAVGRR